MRSNREWRSWGKADPLWSVASWPGRQAGGASPWTPEDFINLGVSDFGDIRAHWDHFGLQPGTCVEIGCGAGRMTKPLLSVFDRVIALDVSDDQILTARRLLGPLASRVEFHRVDDPAIPRADVSCQAMFSCHVFQHFSSFSGIRRYLQEAHRVLAPGSTICFHLPVPGAHRGSQLTGYGLAIRNVAATVRRLVGNLRIMEYHQYSPTRVFDALEAIGFRDAELRIFEMTSNGDAHSFFFARRP